MVKRSENRWNRNRIIQLLKQMHRRGADLSYCRMARANQAIVSAANYHFGSYRRAVQMAGLNYADIRRKPRWTRALIVRMIQQAAKARVDLSWRAVSHRRDELGRAALAAVHPRLFGKWELALRAAGLKADEVSRYRHWKPKCVIDELRRRYKAGQGVNSGAIQNDVPGMYRAAVRHFGSFDGAIAAAKLNPQNIRRRRQWSRRDVTIAMKDFAKRHGSLSDTTLRRLDCGLLRAVRVHFGSLPVARKTLRFDGLPLSKAGAA